MHQLYLVLLQDEQSSSKEARTKATEVLQEQGFVSEGGYFAGGKGDWFVIGGRWSGFLTDVIKTKKELKEKDFDRDQYRILGYPDDAKKLTKELLKALTKRLGKKEWLGVEVFDELDCDEKDMTNLKDEQIGKWIVVVDYHS